MPWQLQMADAGGVDTIARRLRWILRYRELTQRELCRRAGMAETQLGVILRRLEENPLGVELSTLSRLAEGGKVDFHWLVTGIGRPSGQDDALRDGAPLADRPDWRALVSEVLANDFVVSIEAVVWAGGVILPADSPEVTAAFVSGLAHLKMRADYVAEQRQKSVISSVNPHDAKGQAITDDDRHGSSPGRGAQRKATPPRRRR
ncbi:MAG: XRE family transcriptional regulator [Myxococcaceae bacterium]|nr:MAG: XRE family transcriptional regulator [Myxococcaceae bacterium]